MPLGIQIILDDLRPMNFSGLGWGWGCTACGEVGVADGSATYIGGYTRGGLHSIFYVFEDPKPSFQFLPGILGVKASQKF